MPTFLLNNLQGNAHLLVTLAAFSTMAWLGVRRAEAQGIPRQRSWDVVFWGGAAGVLGARLAHVLPEIGAYASHPVDILRFNFGLYFYGGIAGGTLGALWTLRGSWTSLLRMAGAFGPFLPLAIAVDRLGCVAVTACHGRIAEPPLGVFLPGLTIPRFPSQIYEGLLALAIFGLVLAAESRLKGPGAAWFLALALYGPVRAAVDVTRLGWPDASLWIDQAIALLVSAGAIAVLLSRRRAAAGPVPPVSSPLARSRNSRTAGPQRPRREGSLDRP